MEEDYGDDHCPLGRACTPPDAIQHIQQQAPAWRSGARGRTALTQQQTAAQRRELAVTAFVPPVCVNHYSALWRACEGNLPSS